MFGVAGRTTYQTWKEKLHMYLKLIIVVFLAAVLSACSARGPSLPADVSPVPAASLQSSSVGTSDPPGTMSTKGIGTPVPGWENIPIMPGAYNAELEDMVYLYSVQETVDQAEEYYQTKLTVNGWTLTNRQVMQTSASSGASTILDFQKNDQQLNVMLVHVPDDDSTAVILSQLGQ